MPADTSYLDVLNTNQRAAVIHGVGDPVPKPLLVIAGAGSGKTNTLAHRVAHLIANGADARRILLVTFSRRAASEMARRVERIAGKTLGITSGAVSDALTWSGTFHGIGARLLREHAHQIGLDPAFTIHDREDSADLINLVRHELKFSDAATRFPTKGTCLAIYSRVVNAKADLDEVLKAVFPWCAMWSRELRTLFGAYVEAKQQQNVLDYDDLLLYWAGMMAEPTIARQVSDLFDHILVDEYQDTNRLQASVLLAMRPDGRGLTVVGDDAQSIYSFRAATVRNILDFPGAFTPAADIVTLDRNYRSTQPILAAANAVIEQASERFTKNLWSERASEAKPLLVTVKDEADQVGYVAKSILAAREAGTPLKQQAVLFRTSSHSGPLEIELTRRNIPFVKFGGLKFLDAAHIKDLLAILRWVENPRDRVAGFRVLQLMPGVGPGTAGRALDAVGAHADPVWAFSEMPAPVKAGQHWSDLVALARRISGKEVSWPLQIAYVRQWYEPLLEAAYEDASVRVADIAQLEQIAAGYASRERFLTELTLDPPDATSDRPGVPLRDEDYLVLSTIHSAKGQEWKSVHVLNVVDGCIPSDLGTGSTHELEEERRLLYVAMTRAKDELHLIVPQRFYVTQQTRSGDRHLYAQRTRFIPRSMTALFDDILWPPVTPIRDDIRPARPAVVDIAAKMRGMW
ncbi:ATP-dependent DNA helicase [Devosia riboflavina]|uniref:DNA 3'-5' helicase n=1 Tax=Devosia riboflavina TaxID=46914 RepID=A0A087M2N1_9HYPH|nr:ATP-dependent helicase [Devosia riboflavina]KFL31134.1 ATP-dependent DNA helicase [Devosia riboflavina]